MTDGKNDNVAQKKKAICTCDAERMKSDMRDLASELMVVKERMAMIESAFGSLEEMRKIHKELKDNYQKMKDTFVIETDKNGSAETYIQMRVNVTKRKFKDAFGS